MYGCRLANLAYDDILMFQKSFSIFSIVPPTNLRKKGCVHAGEQFKLLLVSSEAMYDVDGVPDPYIDSTYLPLSNMDGTNTEGFCRMSSTDDQGAEGKDYISTIERTEIQCKNRCSNFENCLAYEYNGDTCEIWLTKPSTINYNKDSYCMIKQFTVAYRLVNDALGSCRVNSLQNKGYENEDYILAEGVTSPFECRSQCSNDDDCMGLEYSSNQCKIWFTMPNLVEEAESEKSCEFKHLLSSKSNYMTHTTAQNTKSDYGKISALFSLQTFI
eukprot:Awhi_evm1s9566